MKEKIKLLIANISAYFKGVSIKTWIIAVAIIFTSIIIILISYIAHNRITDRQKEQACEKLGGTYVRGRVHEFCLKDYVLLPFEGEPK